MPRLVPALDRFLELEDLPLDTLEKVAHPGGQPFQGTPEGRLSGKARGLQDVRPPGFEGDRHGVIESRPQTLQKRVDLFLIELAFDVDVLHHFPGEARIGGAEGDGVQVAEDDVPVTDPEVRRGDLAGDHLGGFVEEVAVVRRAPGVAEDDANPGAAAGAPSALRVVVRPRRDVAQDDGVEPSHVDAHFQGR